MLFWPKRGLKDMTIHHRAAYHACNLFARAGDECTPAFCLDFDLNKLVLYKL